MARVKTSFCLLFCWLPWFLNVLESTFVGLSVNASVNECAYRLFSLTHAHGCVWMCGSMNVCDCRAWICL